MRASLTAPIPVHNDGVYSPVQSFVDEFQWEGAGLNEVGDESAQNEQDHEDQDKHAELLQLLQNLHFVGA